MSESQRRIKAFGEIALGVGNLDAMRRFYPEVVGLELMRRFDHTRFIRLAQSYGGHTQVLALFDRSAQPGYRGLNLETSMAPQLPPGPEADPVRLRERVAALDPRTPSDSLRHASAGAAAPRKAE